nr:hypothetical protein [Tanacetum cinerariifolium]
MLSREMGLMQLRLQHIGNKDQRKMELHTPKRDLRLIDEHFESASVDVSTVSSSDGKTVDVKGVVSKEEPKPAKKNNFSPPIIKDWVSENEEENEHKFQKQVNTAKGKVVVNVVKGNGFNAVKASAYWEWRPKKNVLEHVSKHNNASITLERLYYIDAHGRSKGGLLGLKDFLSAVKVTAAGYGIYW